MIFRCAMFFIAVVLLLGVRPAHADCPSANAGLNNGLCQAQQFSQADASLTQDVSILAAKLPPAQKAALKAEEQAFVTQRNKACQTAGYVNFGCAAAQTQARLAVLNKRLAQLAPSQPLTGHYVVPGTAMPWIWKPNGLNEANAFGRQDGTGPTVLSLAGLQASPGQILIIRHVSGTITVGNRALMPAYFHKLGGLVGGFTDALGRLVGQPFAVDQGSAQEIIPEGATQLQLGISDDSFAGNTGSIEVAVRVSPMGKVLPGGEGLHGCAVFGASLGPLCQDYPDWTSGRWLPPPGSGSMHVLVVGGGGGGGMPNFLSGVGGTGGGSGVVVDARIPVPDAPIEVRVGMAGAGGTQTQAGVGGTSSEFGPVVAPGGWGGQAQAGGSAAGTGGHNGGGGGGGGTYQSAFDAGAGGIGGSGGEAGGDGAGPVDVEDGVAGTSGGQGAAFPLFDYGAVKVTAAPGGAGGGFGSGGVNDVGDACSGGGGGGGGGGGIQLNGTGPASTPATTALLPFHCGEQGGAGMSGVGYGAGGGGVGDGMAGPGGNGTNGVVLVVW